MTPHLDGLPLSEPVRRQLDFLIASHHLTGVLRLNRLLDGSRSKSSAEQTDAAPVVVAAGRHRRTVPGRRAVRR